MYRGMGICTDIWRNIEKYGDIYGFTRAYTDKEGEKARKVRIFLLVRNVRRVRNVRISPPLYIHTPISPYTCT